MRKTKREIFPSARLAQFREPGILPSQVFPEEVMIGLDPEISIRGLAYQEYNESYEEGNFRQK